MIKHCKHILLITFLCQLAKGQTSPVVVPEKSPEYPGGFIAFFKLLQNNLNSSLLADDSISGGCQTFYLSFVVDSTGETKYKSFLYHRKPVKKEAEILEVLQKDTKLWKPGLSDGKPINVIYNLPIRIRFF